MNKLFALLFALIMAIPAHNVFAQTDKLNEVLSKISGADNGIETMEVDFNQNMVFTETNEKQISKGHLSFMKPRSILVERTTPQEQKIYIDAKNMTIFTPKTKQAIVSKISDSGGGDFSPVSFINFGGNWKNLQKNNVINYISESDDEYVLEIIPKDTKKWVMTINISKQSLNPNVIIVNSDTLSIQMTLTNYKINQEINKAKFRFVAAKGIDTIKLD
jgi:outer membrane lipoprotein-sorting protein